MKPIKSALVLSLMEDHDWDCLHDVVYDAANVGEEVELDRATLEKVLRRLDDHILGSALQWGMSDTVVRDNAYEHIQEKVEEHGSLDAWLATEPLS